MPALPRLARTASRSVAWTLGVAASLLTFPAHIPWMIAAWFGLFALAAWHNRSMGVLWPALLAGPVVAVIKGTNPSPGLIVVAAAAVLAAAVLPLLRRRITDVRMTVLVTGVPLWISLGVLMWEGREATCSSQSRGDRTIGSIVCIGDSLTAPEGAGRGYPEALAELVPYPIVNLGQDGITTTDALAKLPRLREAAPRVVVIELGGHDFLKGHARASAKANLVKLVAATSDVGADVILVEVPRGFIFDPWYGLERELARELDLELVPDSVIRRFVLFSPFAPPGMWLPRDRLLSEDGLHPNRAGKQAFAEAVAAAIRRMLKS